VRGPDITGAPGTAARLLFRGTPVARGAVLAAAALALAACTGTPSTASGAGHPATATPTATRTVSPTAGHPTTAGGPTATYPGAAWPTYNQNPARTGIAPGLAAAGPLSRKWTAALDGAVYGQPLVVGGLVIAATESDTVYALDEATGKTVWSAHLAAPVPQSELNGCGDIFPLGITGTPVYDQANGLVYAVAETTVNGVVAHELFGLSVSDGAVMVRRDVDITSAANQPAYNQQRPALTIEDGRVYVAFGGLYGDCGSYIGSVVGVPLSGSGSLISWHTPTSREGAVWGTGGPVTGPGGSLWISNGNGAAGPGDGYDGSDSVTELSPALQRTGYFAPGTWATDNASDLDLGSTQPVLAAGDAVFVMGKGGVGYLLAATHLGGIGGQLAEQSICNARGAAAVAGSTVYEPCQDGGMAAIDVDAATRTIKVLWRGPADANGSPVIGGGAVWVTSYSDDGGTLYELNPATGAVEQQIAIGQGMPHFSSLSLSGSTAYVSTLSGITAVSGA